MSFEEFEDQARLYVVGALDEAEAAGLSLPGLELAKCLYERLAEEGGAELGTQALWQLYSA